MGFNPGTGMTPNDWVETEARRAEREQRASANRYGRELSGRSRRMAAWVLGIGALALVVYAILGWLGAIRIPGFNA
jgi:hypothetical protein